MNLKATINLSVLLLAILYSAYKIWQFNTDYNKVTGVISNLIIVPWSEGDCYLATVQFTSNNEVKEVKKLFNLTDNVKLNDTIDVYIYKSQREIKTRIGNPIFFLSEEIFVFSFSLYALGMVILFLLNKGLLNL